MSHTLVRYVGDKKIPVKAIMLRSCQYEVLSAEVHTIGTGDTLVQGDVQTETVYGQAKGNLVSVLVDLSTIPIGQEYTMIIKSSRGVVYRQPLAIIAQDGYTTTAI